MAPSAGGCEDVGHDGNKAGQSVQATVIRSDPFLPIAAAKGDRLKPGHVYNRTVRRHSRRAALNASITDGHRCMASRRTKACERVRHSLEH